ncbi:hypothetical protein BBJ28_00010930 [Nothophytophthora sp. Chile5]|nr:hypothetical protein BBJ28_00010930 [Nothophytophthora sp. Chile5]
MTDEQQEQKPATALTVDPVVAEEPSAEAAAVSTPATEGTPSNGTSLGGRVRKATQKFSFGESKGDEAEEFTPPVGRGVKVRDIPFVGDNLEALGKKQMEVIKQLYSIMFGRRFQQKNEHILNFSGVCEQDDKVDRSKKSFDEASKTFDKYALIDRLIDWLYNPQETEPAKKKRKTTKKAAAGAEDEDEDDEATESEGEDSSSDFDGAQKGTKTKRRKVTRKPKSRAIESDDEGEGEKEETEAAEADNTEEQPAAEPDVEEPKAAEKEEPKPTPTPLADDVCEKVRDIIAHGNAEELTVKKVCTYLPRSGHRKIVRQLSADLGRDMSSQKKAIKEFITEGQVLE